MRKKRQLLRLQGGLLTLLLVMFTLLPVSAAGTSKMILKTTDSTYEKGSIVTAQIFIHNAEFNAAGFSLQYDTGLMAPVTEDGTDANSPGKVIRLSDKYDENTGTGTFTMLDRSLDTKRGTVTAVFYVNPEAGKTASADENGLLAAELSFKMLKSGAPDVKFAVIKDSADFYAVPSLMVNNGSQMEVAEAEVKYGEESEQTVDVSKPVIEKADAQAQDGNTDSENEGAEKQQADQKDSTDKKENQNKDADSTKKETEKKEEQNNASDASGEKGSQENGKKGGNESIEDFAKQLDKDKGQGKQEKTSYAKYGAAGVVLLIVIAAIIVYFKKKKANK